MDSSNSTAKEAAVGVANVATSELAMLGGEIRQPNMGNLCIIIELVSRSALYAYIKGI
jgi:hypothetical protein